MQHGCGRCAATRRRRVRQCVSGLGLAGAYLLVLAGPGCEKSSQLAPPITLVLIDQSWATMDYQVRLKEALAEFTRETGIRVESLPAPETAVEQLATWRTLLESGKSTPDVYGIDVIWPGVLADHLLDLKAFVPSDEIAAHFPELIANNTVDDRLVALPTNLGEGLLYYRVDLLREYGYPAPPRTWEELEVQAGRIQAGERAKGKTDFWGFLWQGSPSEALTCNALEWQASEGGGTILGDDQKVTVNNPHTIRAWARAARWVGSISPPGVIAHKEWDSINIWLAGNAAFMRNWPGAYMGGRARHTPIEDRFDVASLPRGSAGVSATLGGSGYGISRHSRHPREAARLVRYLCSREQQAKRSRNTTEPPTIPDLYGAPDVLANNQHFTRILEVFREGITLRPSRAAGKLYPDVSRAYFEAVHAVLTGSTSAARAAPELEDRLQRMLEMPGREKADIDEKPAPRR